MSTVSGSPHDGNGSGRRREFPTIGNIQELFDMPDDDFNALVEAEVRNLVPAQTAEMLRNADLSERWYWALVKLKKSVENQIGAKRSDLRLLRSTPEGRQVTIGRDTIVANAKSKARAQSDFYRWRGGAIRFKNSVEERMLRLRSHRTTLLMGIARHREFVLQNYPEDITDADRMLWDLADQAHQRAG